MVVALGITFSGEKRFLGFVETDTENEKVLTPFLRSLVERGLDIVCNPSHYSQAPYHFPVRDDLEVFSQRCVTQRGVVARRAV
jgi:hypothetical protein